MNQQLCSIERFPSRWENIFSFSFFLSKFIWFRCAFFPLAMQASKMKRINSITTNWVRFYLFISPSACFCNDFQMKFLVKRRWWHKKIQPRQLVAELKEENLLMWLLIAMCRFESFIRETFYCNVLKVTCVMVLKMLRNGERKSKLKFELIFDRKWNFIRSFVLLQSKILILLLNNKFFKNWLNFSFHIALLIFNATFETPIHKNIKTFFTLKTKQKKSTKKEQ
jgi:hypothetical protein